MRFLNTFSLDGKGQIRRCRKARLLGQRRLGVRLHRGPGGATSTTIRQTSDGGYIAVGGTVADESENGALILKLSSTGSVQWQEALGPVGSTLETFNAVAQTSDGGYLAVGDTYSERLAIQTVLVVKFASSGSVQWEKTYNQGSGDRVANSLVLTTDGGYLIAGSTSSGTPTGYTGVSYLLIKLDSSGNIQWQQAYNGGGYCERPAGCRRGQLLRASNLQRRLHRCRGRRHPTR